MTYSLRRAALGAAVVLTLSTAVLSAPGSATAAPVREVAVTQVVAAKPVPAPTVETARTAKPLSVKSLGVVKTSARGTTVGGYTRSQRLARAQQLMNASLAGFMRIQRGTKKGIDKYFDWSNDGCSAPWFTFRAYYNGVFHEPCLRHDFGYRNFGSGWYASTNRAFGSSPAVKKAIDAIFSSDAASKCTGKDNDKDCRNNVSGFATALEKTGQAQTAFYKGECQPGLLCLFDDDDFNDRRVALSASEDDLKDVSFGDKTSSVKNTSSYAWRLHDDADYGDRYKCSTPGTTYTNMGDADFNDKASSAIRLSGRTC